MTGVGTDEMRFRTKVLLASVVLLLLLAVLARTGIYALLASSHDMIAVWKDYPYAPYCVALFCILIGGVLVIATVGYLKYQANKMD